MADSIYKKLLAIRREVSFVKVRKAGVSYPVLDGDTVLEMVGNALAKHGIVFMPSMVNAEIMYVEINKKMVQHALATIELIFMDTESGETFTVTTHGSGQSYDGKALGIAQTYGIKYFFYRMFLKGESDIEDEVPDTPPPSELDAPRWTQDRQRIAKLRDIASEHWTDENGQPMAWPHVHNRIAILIGSELRPVTLDAFVDMMEHECKFDPKEMMDEIEGYAARQKEKANEHDGSPQDFVTGYDDN